MTISPSGPAVVAEYGVRPARPRTLLQTLRDALASFAVHFFLF